MLELINTSVPSGLIAGARGFATVAMSRGLNDRARLQLEELCSYAHRTSAHDGRYWRENPVHWFHLILRQGEHVLGCVAPAEFDYTGRTNRLGHVALLRAAEMPALGGTALLRAMKATLAAPWGGEPHYLEETAVPPASPSVGGTAHWQELLGTAGAAMAQRLAWHLLRQTQSATPVPLYFKLSTAWDASGEKALALFDELIALLPPEHRAKITFSTYATTLPMGGSCLLRAIFDEDKTFAALSQTHVWVDCTQGRIVNAGQLPERDPTPQAPSLPMPRKDAPPTVPESPRQHSGNGRIQVSKQALAQQQLLQRYLQAGSPKRDASKKAVLIAAGVAAVLLLATLGYGLAFYYRQTVSSPLLEKTEAAEGEAEEEMTLLAEPKPKAEEPAGPSAEELAEEKQRREAEEAKRKADEAKAQEERERKAKQQAEEVQRKADEAKAQAERERKAKEEENAKRKELEAKRTAYTRATKATAGKPDTKPGSQFLVYFYEGKALRTYVVSVEKKMVGLASKLLETWQPVGEADTKPLTKAPEATLAKSPCVLWLNIKKQELHFEFHFDLCAGTWFDGKTDSVSLSEKAFGPDPKVYETWKSLKSDTKFVIKSIDLRPISKPILTRVQVQEKRDAAKAKQRETVEQRIKELEKTVADLENEERVLEAEKTELEGIPEKEKALAGEIKKAEGEKKTKLKEKKTQLMTRKGELKEKIEKLPQKKNELKEKRAALAAAQEERERLLRETPLEKVRFSLSVE